TRVEAAELDDDWNIGDNDARVICIQGHRFGPASSSSFSGAWTLPGLNRKLPDQFDHSCCIVGSRDSMRV
ncbi:MAG: hypothetical protein RBS57_11715, partial [Desulforhabdus sp.]|nr:hypothetical protein [Desulforhabdus sp.]